MKSNHYEYELSPIGYNRHSFRFQCRGFRGGGTNVEVSPEAEAPVPPNQTISQATVSPGHDLYLSMDPSCGGTSVDPFRMYSIPWDPDYQLLLDSCECLPHSATCLPIQYLQSKAECGEWKNDHFSTTQRFIAPGRYF